MSRQIHTNFDTLSKRVRRLGRLPPSIRARAIAEGVMVAPAPEAALLGASLLELACVPGIVLSGQGVPHPGVWDSIRRAPVAWLQRSLRTGREFRSRAALAALARCWAHLPEDVRSAALTLGKGRWPTALAGLIDTRAGVRRGLCLLAQESECGELAFLAGQSLEDEREAVREAAERAIEGLALIAAGFEPIDAPGRLLGPPPALDDTGRAALEGTVAEAMILFDRHRSRGVLAAAWLLLDPSRSRGSPTTASIGRIREAALDRASAVQAPASSFLRFSREPWSRLRALQWIDRESVHRAAAGRLARASTALDHELVLRSTHLGLRPFRAQRLRNVPLRCARAPRRTPAQEGVPARAIVLETDAAAPRAELLRQLTPLARRRLPTWVSMLAADAPARTAALVPLLGDEDALVRLAVVRQAPAALLQDLVFDVDQRVSRSAYLAWRADRKAISAQGEKGDSREVLGVLARLPHARTRALAGIDREREADWWEETPAGRLRARVLLRADRTGFIAELRGALADPALPRCEGAITAVGRLRITADLQAELCAIASAPLEAADLRTRRMIASAVRVLGDCDTGPARAVALAATGSGDSRVRANAVEALDAMSRRATAPLGIASAVLAELKADGHHRVRANALRATLAATIRGDLPQSGPGELDAMLADERPAHRLAGVWLASRVLPPSMAELTPGDLRWARTSALVAELANFDDDPQVRLRASVCLATIEPGSRAGRPAGAAQPEAGA